MPDGILYDIATMHDEFLDDVSGPSVTTNKNTATISWSDPSDGSITKWAGTKVVRKAGSAPQSVTDGVVIVDNKSRNQYSSTGYTDLGLEYDTVYYYRFFPYGTNKLTTEGTAISIKPERTIIENVPEQDGTLTYTGSAQTAEFLYYDSSQMTVVGDTQTDVGTYQATFTPKNDYMWSDKTRTGKSATWSIGKKILYVPEQTGTLSYTGSAQSPSWDANYIPSLMSVSGNSQIDAGSYQAVFHITDSTNCEWNDGLIGDQPASWSIGKAEISPTVSVANYAYNGTVSTPTISGNTGNGEVTFYSVQYSSSGASTEWDEVTSTSFAPGTRYCYATVEETTNYQGATTPRVAYNITKGTFTPTLEVSGYTYNGSDKTNPTITGVPGSAGSPTFYSCEDNQGTNSNTWSNTTTTTYDAGTRYCYAVIPENTYFERVQTAYVPYTISKGTLSGVVVISNYAYGGTKSTPSIASPAGSTVTYYGRAESNGQSTDWDSVTSTTYSAGTRYVYAVISESTNYNQYTSPETSFTITKATFTATVSLDPYTYGGTKSTPSISNNPGGGTVTYYAKASSSGTATAWDNVTSTTYNAGSHVIYATVSETANYAAYTTANASFTINRGTFTATVSIDNYNYGGTKSTPTLSNNPGGGAVTFYGRDTASGTATAWGSVTSTTYNAGTHYCYAVVAQSTNYESYTTENASFTVNKGTFTATVSISGYTYAGTKSSPTVSSNPGSGTVTYYGRATSGGASTNWSSVTSTTYNAGTRYCYAVIGATTNYNECTTAEKSFTISKATGSMTLSSNAVTLTPASTSSTVTVTRPGDGVISATSSDTTIATVSVSGTTLTISSPNSSTGTATITVSLAAGTNYTAPASQTISVDAQFAHVSSWTNGTDTQVASLIAQADRGEIDLYEDCGWRVGDERVVSISAIAASGTYDGYSWNVAESHVAQDIVLVLMDVGKTSGTGTTYNDTAASNYTLVTSVKNKDGTTRTNPAFIVGVKNVLSNGTTAEDGPLFSSSTGQGSWTSCPRRNWCNGGFRQSLPSTLRDIFKKVNFISGKTSSSTNETVQDYFALPAMKELSNAYGDIQSTAGVRTFYTTTQEFNALKTFEYYTVSANRIKYRSSSSTANSYWGRSPRYDKTAQGTYMNQSGSPGTTSSTSSSGMSFSPIGVI